MATITTFILIVIGSLFGLLISYHNCLSGLPIEDNLKFPSCLGISYKNFFTWPFMAVANSSTKASTLFSEIGGSSEVNNLLISIH